MARALSVYQVLASRPNCMAFDGEWQRAIGSPEMCGSWIIWGGSYNGKTTFAMQLAKYLTRFDRVLYNSLEEGSGRSIQIALQRAAMVEVGRRFTLLENFELEELAERLRQKKAPRIVVMDSLQYSGLDYKSYRNLKRDFPRVLWIWISHAEGRLPEGRLANKVRYDAMVKIRVDGYRAYINSRYNEADMQHNFMTIWEDGARKFWGEKNSQEQELKQ